MSEIQRAKKIIIELGLWFDAHDDPEMCDKLQALLTSIDEDFLRKVGNCSVRYQKPAFSYHTIYIALKMVGVDNLDLVDKIHAELREYT